MNYVNEKLHQAVDMLFAPQDVHKRLEWAFEYLDRAADHQMPPPIREQWDAMYKIVDDKPGQYRSDRIKTLTMDECSEVIRAIRNLSHAVEVLIG